jgi:hypothetical protein
LFAVLKPDAQDLFRPNAMQGQFTVFRLFLMVNNLVLLAVTVGVTLVVKMVKGNIDYRR